MEEQNGKLLLFNIGSETIPGKQYTVRFYKGSWACDCPDFIFNKGFSGECKHLRKVFNWERVEND